MRITGTFLSALLATRFQVQVDLFVMDVLSKTNSGVLLFWCPGCSFYHGVWPNGLKNPDTGATWTWNGSLTAPTFSPSVLVKYPLNGVERVCHSTVTDGRISFCTDSAHHLAGKTVQLPPADRVIGEVVACDCSTPKPAESAAGEYVCQLCGKKMVQSC